MRNDNFQQQNEEKRTYDKGLGKRDRNVIERKDALIPKPQNVLYILYICSEYVEMFRMDGWL